MHVREFFPSYCDGDKVHDQLRMIYLTLDLHVAFGFEINAVLYTVMYRVTRVVFECTWGNFNESFD